MWGCLEAEARKGNEMLSATEIGTSLGVISAIVVSATVAYKKIAVILKPEDKKLSNGNGRRKVASQEAHDGIEKLWEKKADKDHCAEIVSDMKTDMVSIKKKLDTMGPILYKIAGKLGVDT